MNSLQWSRIGGLAAVIVLATFPAFGDSLVVSREDCDRLIRHEPSADVNYQPGVDVYGRAVAPADLPGSPQLQLPETFSFDINIDMSKYMTSAGLGTQDLKVGTVTYDVASGRLTFNGQPLTDADQSAVAEACRQAYAKGH